MMEINDFGGKNEDCSTCSRCTNVDGSIKECEEIFENSVVFFMDRAEVPRQVAKKLARKGLLSLSMWDIADNKCLEGEIASNDEFVTAISSIV